MRSIASCKVSTLVMLESGLLPTPAPKYASGSALNKVAYSSFNFDRYFFSVRLRNCLGVVGLDANVENIDADFLLALLVCWTGDRRNGAGSLDSDCRVCIAL